MGSNLSEQAAFEREQRRVAEAIISGSSYNTGGVPTPNDSLVPPPSDATHLQFKHSINIQPLNRGFLVNFGCQSIAFETHRKMLKYLSEYLANPQRFEAEYREGLVLKEEY